MSASVEPTVSIVIPVHDRADLTEACLTRLAAVTRGRFELIVVDDASTDATPSLLARFASAVTVVRHDVNVGFARACNSGAARARGDHLVFLNNDTLPGEGWLAALVAAAADPQVGLVGARLLYPDGRVQHAGIGFDADFEPVHLFQGAPGDAPEVTTERDCEAVTGACILIPRALFTTLGGFDEGYRMYFEDIDLCLRVRAAGRRIRYAAGSVLVHLERGSSPSFGAAYAWNRQSRERFRARWLGGRAAVRPRADASPPGVGAGQRAMTASPAERLALATAVAEATRANDAAAPVAPSRAALGPRRRGPSVLFQARATLFSHPGGDTVVVRRLMHELAGQGLAARFSATPGVPPGTDVVHAINFATPEITARFAVEAERAHVPLVVTTLYEDWPRFLHLMQAAPALLHRMLGPDGARAGVALDRLAFGAALARARGLPPPPRAANDVTAGLARVLHACADSERARVAADYPAARDVRVIPFGADQHVDAAGGDTAGAFAAAHGVRDFVLCVGRLEHRKNQLLLLEALRDDPRPLVLIGGGVTYHAEYAAFCRAFRRRGPTLVLDRVPSALLRAAFAEAAVHCLPSWYELPGLVSLEAARHGARVAASGWGALEEYLGDTVAYCEPDDPESIRRAVERACALPVGPAAERARAFTWTRTATELRAVYEAIVPAGRATSAAPDAVGATSARPAAGAPTAAVATPVGRDAGADQDLAARATALARAGQLAGAETLFQRLLASPAVRRRAQVGLGVIALERGNPAAARAWLERATADGADANAWAALGLCLSRLARGAQAWEAFARARAVDPAHRGALHGLITLAAAHDRPADLEPHLRAYLTQVGDDVDVRCALASCLHAAGRVADSRETLAAVLARAPDHAVATRLAAELAR